MTKAQIGKYRAIWSRVKKALCEFGDFSAEDAELQRKSIQVEAIGSDKSSTLFTNDELNLVLDAFDKILVIFDGPGDQPTRNAANKIWAITKTGLPEAYLQSISQDQFGTPDWRKLPDDKLAKFRFTAVSRAAAKRKAARTGTQPSDSDDPF